MTLEEYAAFACRLADAARVETLGRWRAAGLSANKAETGEWDPVTDADVAAETAMRALIGEVYPDHGIAGEELDDQPSVCGLSWSLDPIDGTRSFVCGLPTWTTLIALLEDGEPMLGVIDAPRLDERYIGYGKSAQLVTDDGNAKLATSGCRTLAEARLSSTDPALFADAAADAFEQVRAAVRVVRYGHDGYAYARLAAGTIDLVVEAGLQPYDLNALIPVVCGAGGIVGNWRGGSDVSGGDLLAAATPELFAAATGILSSPAKGHPAK